MKRTAILSLVLITLAGAAAAESPYTLDLTKDLIIGSAALGAFFPGILIDPSPGDPIAKSSINGLDRSFMFSYSKTQDSISTGGAYALLMLPALSVLGHLREPDVLLTYGVMYAEAFFLTWATKDLLKLAVSRNRPYTYQEGAGVYIPPGEEKDYFNSFPSGHTSFAFLGATFLTTTFLTEYPDSKWKIPVIAGSYTLAAGIAVMRITSGNHFITDVLAGAAIGSLYGWLVPRLHLSNKNRSNFAITPAGTGLVFSFSI